MNADETGELERSSERLERFLDDFERGERRERDVFIALGRAVAALMAGQLDDPIWWCFEHGVSVPDGNFEMCAHFEWQLAMGRTIAPCDIARATRPRRIQ